MVKQTYKIDDVAVIFVVDVIPKEQASSKLLIASRNFVRKHFFFKSVIFIFRAKGVSCSIIRRSNFLPAHFPSTASQSYRGGGDGGMEEGM